MKTTSALRRFLCIASSALLAISYAHAAPGTWNANANGDWNDSGNWDSNTVADGAGSLATLGNFIDADRIINLDIAPIIGGITAADTSHNFTISGASTLTLDSTGSSAVSVPTAGRTLTIDSVLAGNDGISKSGAGTLALSNANSISGIFALTAGTLQLGNATSMGTSTLTMTSGTTLQLRNDSNTVFAAPVNTAPTTGITYNFDVNQATEAGTNKKLSLGNITFATSSSGSITNTINVTGGNGYTLGLGTISAPSGGGSLHPVIINATTAAVEIAKFSAGSYGHALELKGGNTITLTNFEMGSNGSNTLTVSGSGTVVNLGTTTQTNSRAGGTAAYTLNNGTLNLTTTSSLANVRAVSGTLSAPTFTINGGTLNNTSGSALTLAASPGTGTIAGSPAITIGGNFAFGTVSSTSGNNLNLGTGAITNAGNHTITFNGLGTTLTMGGTMTNGMAGNQTTTVNGTGNTLSLGGYSLGVNRVNVFNGTGNVNITGVITQLSGTSGLTYSGSGTLTISGSANTFTGNTTINSGTLAINSSGKLYSTSTSALTTVNSSGTLEVYSWAYGANGSIGNPYFGTSTLAVNGGTIKYTGIGEDTGNNQGRVFAIGSGGATLDAAGSGTWLIKRNTPTGDQTIGSGLTLTLTGTSNGAYSNNLIGSGGKLTKSGSGTWTLAGTNTYTGTTAVTEGKLTISSNGTINGTSGVAIGAGDFNYNSGTALSKSVTFSGTDGTLSGTGTITPAVVITSGNRQTAGSSVTATSTTASVGKEIFSTSITYNQDSIFEWNLNADNGVGLGTRGIDYDAVNTASLATTGTKAIFRVILNGTDNFDEAFWNTDRTWSNIFTGLDGMTALNIANVFKSTVEYYNSAGSVANGNATRTFNISGTSLTWTAIPEPTSALAGLLLTAGLLRRRRN